MEITDDYRDIFLVENKEKTIDIYTSFTNKDSITIHRIKNQLITILPVLKGKLDTKVSILAMNGTMYIPKKHYTFYILQAIIMNDYFKRPNSFSR